MSLLSPKWVRYGLLPGILIIVAGSFIVKTQSDKEPETHKVGRGEIIQEVSLTGSVKALRDLDLGFERGGKIAGAYVKVGDQVKTGQDLIRLDSSEIYASLLGAQATLKQYQADLAALLRGKRPEEISIDETKVQNADQSLSDYRKLLANTLSDGYTKVDDGIRVKADDTFDDPLTSPKFLYSLSETSLKSRLEADRLKMETLLNKYKNALASVSISNGEIGSVVAIAEETLYAAASFLNDLSSALNSLSASSSLSQTVLDGYRTDVAAGRTNVNTAISNLSSAANNVRTAEATLRLAEDQLKLNLAAPTDEAVASAQAKVDSASASVLNYQAQFLKMTVRAPIDGVVTKQDQRAGEIVTAGESVISLISSEGLEVEASAPEVDVGALEVGMSANFTLDAFPDSYFTGVIIKIDPAETVLEGVPTYNVTFKIDRTDIGVKPGMTANVTVVTNQRLSVIVVPLRAIDTREDGTYVDVLGENNTRLSKKIVTGLRGTDGSVEVLEGLTEGEKVFLDRISE